MLSTLNLGVRSGVFGNNIILSELLSFNISGNCVGVGLWELVVSWEVFARNKKSCAGCDRCKMKTNMYWYQQCGWLKMSSKQQD